MPTLLIFELISLGLTAARLIVGNRKAITKGAHWVAKKLKEGGVEFDTSKFDNIGP